MDIHYSGALTSCLLRERFDLLRVHILSSSNFEHDKVGQQYVVEFAQSLSLAAIIFGQARVPGSETARKALMGVVAWFWYREGYRHVN